MYWQPFTYTALQWLPSSCWIPITWIPPAEGSAHIDGAWGSGAVHRILTTSFLSGWTFSNVTMQITRHDPRGVSRYELCALHDSVHVCREGRSGLLPVTVAATATSVEILRPVCLAFLFGPDNDIEEPPGYPSASMGWVGVGVSGVGEGEGFPSHLSTSLSVCVPLLVVPYLQCLRL